MKKKLTIDNFFDIDPTPVLFIGKSGKKDEIKHRQKSVFQFKNLAVFTDDNFTTIAIESKSMDYIEEFWNRIYQMQISNIEGFIDYHYNKTVDKKLFLQFVKNSMNTSHLAVFGMEMGNSNRNKLYTEKYRKVVSWISKNTPADEIIAFSLCKKAPEKLKELKGLHKLLAEGKEKFIEDDPEEFEILLTNNTIPGKKLNFISIPKPMILFLLDSISESNPELFNSKYLDKYNRIKPKYIVELILHEDKPITTRQVSDARQDCKKTATKKANSEFIESVKSLLDDWSIDRMIQEQREKLEYDKFAYR